VIHISRRLGETLHALATGIRTDSDTPDTLTEAGEDKLLRFLELLSKWNRVFNLTAITDPGEMLTHHLLDSLSVVTPIDELVAAIPSPRVIDIGSGAGLPGIPLAIARPTWALTLLDSNSKKTAFIQQAAAELQLANVRVITARAEAHSGTYDVIVSRAFSSLREFVAKTRSLLAPGGSWAAMKGAVPDDEFRELPDGVRVQRTIPLHVPGLAAERHLVLLRNAP
jgi:16S rRNA (guanine527-N7)-methyltransferase